MPEAVPKRARVFKFGDCTLDARAGELDRAGTRIRLQEQPLRFLTLLLEHPGELITREDVRRRLWRDGTVVDFEHGINATLKRLREALRDRAEQPRYVETIPRRGYRFIAPVHVISAEPSSTPAPPAQSPTEDATDGVSPPPGGATAGSAQEPDASDGGAWADAGSRYAVLEAIGIGGQGRVHRAHDALLDRDVAVKFLPDWMAHDELALHRLRREAHAAAALNHPNVVAIHDVAVINGAPCLVSELLEGRTLREAIGQPPVPLHEAVGYALQALDGLVAAHAKGIVHRDLKPENIFITREGRVKLLDFGLAKELASSARSNASTTGLQPATRVGAVLGTLGYQSPEQARGEKVDWRSDLFSIGTVIYETLTGRHPFQRRTDADTISAVLHAEPEIPSAINPRVPASCDAIVAKALEKDRELRYQSAADVRADLLRVQREVTGRATPMGAREMTETGPVPARPRRRTARLAAIASAAAAGLLLLGILVLGGEPGLPEFQPVQLTHGPGVQSDPVLSPDGNFIAYSVQENGNADIFVMDRRSRSAIRRTEAPGHRYHPAWLAAGSEVLFVSSADARPSIWRMPAFSGRPTLLLADAQDVSVSPDGREIAFARPSPSSPSGNLRIWVAPLADLNRARVLTGDNDGLWDHREPSWSPDGNRIAYRAQTELWVIPAAGGIARRVVSEGQSELTPAWSQDGKALYFSSGREGTRAIWRMLLATTLRDRLLWWRRPAPERVTLGTGSEQQPSLSRDGRFLAHSTVRNQEGLVVANRATGREIAWDVPVKGSMPAFSPDGQRLYFVSDQDALTSQLCMVELEGGVPRGGVQRLTNHTGHVSHPSVSRDGRWVAYYLVEKNQRTLWVIAAGGGPASRISNGKVDILPAWAPDAGSIFYSMEEGGPSHLAKVRVDEGRPAGQPKQLTAAAVSDEAPAVSPDGQLVAFRRESVEQRGRWDVWVMPADGQAPPRRVTTGADAFRLQWDSRNPGKLFVAGTWGGTDVELRVVDVSSGEAKASQPPLTLAPLKDELVDFSVSPDGRLLAFSRLTRQGNIWLLEARSGTF